MTHRVTIHEVARHAGVSAQTVSRVINDHPRVADATRVRVRQSIAQLDFTPNKQARGLRSRSSGLLGIVAAGNAYADPYVLVQHTQRHAEFRGYEVLLTVLRPDAREHVDSACARLQQFGVDGLLVVSLSDDLQTSALRRSSLPTVVITPVDATSGTTISVDLVGGAVMATEHLIDLGHRSIVHLGGPRGHLAADLCHQGYVQAMTRHGLPPGGRLEGDWSPDSGHAAVRRALDDGVPFTALTVAGAHLALGAMSALRAAGLAVPDEVSVVALEDTEAALHCYPPLTTVAHDLRLLAQRSVDEVLWRISTPSAWERRITVQPHLTVRGSTRLV